VQVHCKDLAQRMQRILDVLDLKQLAEWMTLTSVQEPLDRSEEIAKKRLEEGLVNQGSLLEVVSCLNMPVSGQRPGVPKGEGMPLGLLTYQSKPTLARETSRRPWLCRLLAALGRRKLGPDFVFTSVYVGKNIAADEHTDPNNIGKSGFLTEGRFTGGRLWVDKDGLDCDVPDGELHVHTVKSELIRKSNHFYAAGQQVAGVFLNAHGCFQKFDGNFLHFTESFQASDAKYSFTFYVTMSALQATRDNSPDLEFLRARGFNLPTLEYLENQLGIKKSDESARSERAQYAKSIQLPAAQAASPTSPKCKLAALDAAKQLLGTSSNQTGGTDLVRARIQGVREKLPKHLEDETRRQVEDLLHQASPAGDTFKGKTPSTWRVFVIPILELLGANKSELQELQEKHRLRPCADLGTSKDAQDSVKSLRSLKRRWSESSGASPSKKTASPSKKAA